MPNLIYLEETLQKLKIREESGENVQADIEWTIKEINKYYPTEANTHNNRSNHNIDFKVRGDANFNAVGIGNSVVYNSQQITYQPNINFNAFFNTSGSKNDLLDSFNLFKNTCLWIYHNKPSAVPVSIVTILPVILLISGGNNSISTLFGLFGLSTITPLGIFVLMQTQFFSRDEPEYINNRFLAWSSRFMRILGLLCIMILVGIFVFVALIIRVMSQSFGVQFNKGGRNG